MNFLDALKLAAETGQEFRRRGWPPNAVALGWSTELRDPYAQCRFEKTGAAYICIRKDMLADDWEMLPLPQKTMSFMEAVELMKNGAKVGRLAWPESNRNLIQHKGAFMHYTGAPPTEYVVLAEDVAANDWIQVK